MTQRQFKAAMKTSGELFLKRIRSYIGAYRCLSISRSTHSAVSRLRRNLTRSVARNDAWQSSRSGDYRNSAAARDRGGLRHHGRAAGSREPGDRLAGEFHRHGRRTLHLDHHLRTDFRRALQSSCFRRERLGRAALARPLRRLRTGPVRRRFCSVSPRRTRCLDCRSFNSRCTCDRRSAKA